MDGGGLHGAQVLVLLLLLLVAVFAVLAQRMRLPYPIVLVIAGLGVSLVPHVPRVRLEPEVVFLVFLPPLLYAAAWQTSWREFRMRLVSIVMLAVGLVAFTVIGIALFSDHFVEALDFKSGFLLGAVLSTTDAIAAAAIASRVGLPKGIVELLEGESLLNDATGLLALEFGLRMLETGEVPTLGSGLLRMSWLLFGGLAMGMLIGVVVAWMERWVDDGPVEMVISLVVPYTAYLAGEEVRASGVLAVVACGLYLSRRSVRFFSPATRIQVSNGWKTLDFVLNGLVFLLIGLQLPYVLGEIRGMGLPTLVKYGVGFSAVLIVLRLLWMYPASEVAYQIRCRVLGQKLERWRARDTFVIGWTGMRGVISLAAALSLPETLGDGRPFAQRNLIVFLTFVVILVTLVGQGLTLPWVIRRLGLASDGESRLEEMEARRAMLQDALHYLAREAKGSKAHEKHIVDDVAHAYRHRLRAVERVISSGATQQSLPNDAAPATDVVTGAVRVQRDTAVRLRDEGRIGDGVLDRLLEELDLTEAREQARV